METPIKIEVEGDVLRLTWADGVETSATARELRAGCECAACREPSGMAATQAVLAGATPVSIEDARLVGGYAVAFDFAPDGHSTGIYSYDALRALTSPEVPPPSAEARSR